MRQIITGNLGRLIRLWHKLEFIGASTVQHIPCFFILKMLEIVCKGVGFYTVSTQCTLRAGAPGGVVPHPPGHMSTPAARPSLTDDKSPAQERARRPVAGTQRGVDMRSNMARATTLADGRDGRAARFRVLGLFALCPDITWDLLRCEQGLRQGLGAAEAAGKGLREKPLWV